MNRKEENRRDYPPAIGEIFPTGDGTYKVCRAPSSEGMIYKDWEAFYGHSDKPCYAPELDNEVYTWKDFMDLAGGEADVAEAIFEMAEWQSPSTVLDEFFLEDEVKECNTCGRLYLAHGESTYPCPHCMEAE